jgi:DNA-directed RNA polymerase subunit RPC12/RpoP
MGARNFNHDDLSLESKDSKYLHLIAKNKITMCHICGKKIQDNSLFENYCEECRAKILDRKKSKWIPESKPYLIGGLVGGIHY